jgi:hypothetical protein
MLPTSLHARNGCRSPLFALIDRGLEKPARIALSIRTSTGQLIASLTGLPTRLSISTSVSMVNLAAFLFTTSDTRGRDHQNLGCLGLLQAVFRDPDRQLFHQLPLQQARVIDLLAGRSL